MLWCVVRLWVSPVFSPSLAACWLGPGGQSVLSLRPLPSAAWPDWRRSSHSLAVQSGGVHHCTTLYSTVHTGGGVKSTTLQQDATISGWDLSSQAPLRSVTWPPSPFSEINKSERKLQISPPEQGNFLGVNSCTDKIYFLHSFITGEAGGGKLFTGFFLSTPPHNRHNNYFSNIISTFHFIQSQPEWTPATRGTSNFLHYRNIFYFKIKIFLFEINFTYMPNGKAVGLRILIIWF